MWRRSSSQLAILLFIYWSSNVVAGSATVVSSMINNDDLHSLIVTGPKVDLDPTVEYLGPHFTTTLWQIPPGPVQRVLFIAIGSGMLPYDFWDRTPSCPVCTGLPEMRKIVEDALSRRYAVVVIPPLHFGYDWDAWPQDTTDLINVDITLSMWKRTHGFENVSTVALGISSGGHALSTLGLHGPRLFESMVLMVSKGLKEAWHHARRDFYPPTLFVHCPRDFKSAEAILQTMAGLRREGIPADEVPWNPHPITPTWFSQLIPGLDPDKSRAIYDAFKSEGSILDDDDYLRDAMVHWEYVVRKRGVLPDDPEHPGQVLFKAAIHQELRVAYAMHSTLARRNEEIFIWFEGGYTAREEKSLSLFQAK